LAGHLIERRRGETNDLLPATLKDLIATVEHSGIPGYMVSTSQLVYNTMMIDGYCTWI
jgi:hypothetical protein